MISTVHRRCFVLSILRTMLYGHAAIGQAGHASGDGDLQAVIVLMRHGVRTPIENETRSNAYNAQRWTSWPTKPGILTPHGAEALHLLDDFYRTLYLLLLQNNSCDHSRLYIEANTTQRTIASAKALLTGLSPQCMIEVHSTFGHFNPLFSESMSNAVDHQLIKAAPLGRMADEPEWFTSAFARSLQKMHRVLTDCKGSGCNSSVADFRRIRVQKGIATTRNPRSESPVALGADFAENFLLQYTKVKSMSQLAGAVSRAQTSTI